MTRWREIVRVVAITANLGILALVFWLLQPVQVAEGSEGAGWTLLPMLLLVSPLSIVALIWQPPRRTGR